ncbi:MAG: diguanylate cyclase [Solirubrobacteraceae bacterium]
MMTVRLPHSQRLASLIPYAACFAVTWGLIGLESQLRIGELAAAFALQVLVGVLLVELGDEEPPLWIVLAGNMAFLASVVLLRDGVGATPGYGPLLLLPVIWAALRSRRGELVFAIGGAAAVLFVPIVAIGGAHYAASEWRSGALLLVIAAVLGTAVLGLVGTVARERDTANQMLASQEALGQIATLVATGARPESVFRAVAEQVAVLFGGELASVIRFDGPAGVGRIVGGWTGNGKQITGQTIDLAGVTAAAKVYHTRGAVLIPGYDERWTEPIVETFVLGGAVGAPVFLGGRLWGAVNAAFPRSSTIPEGAQERLFRFAELVAVAIANAEAWETITHQASTDPLTGLANYRTFHERLRSEFERAGRHGRAISLAVFDLDHFKQVNDFHGHQIGDQTLAAVALRIGALARAGELVARIGGEEFVWLMPETTQDGAYLAAERARHAIEAAPFEVAGTLTISVGVCSNEHCSTAHEFLNAADRALYTAKRNGRNTTIIYTQDPAPRLAGESSLYSGREGPRESRRTTTA